MYHTYDLQEGCLATGEDDLVVRVCEHDTGQLNNLWQ